MTNKNTHLLKPDIIDWFWVENNLLPLVDSWNSKSHLTIDLGRLQGPGFETSGIISLLVGLNYLERISRKTNRNLEIIDSNDTLEHKKRYCSELSDLGFGDCFSNKMKMDPSLRKELSYDPSTFDSSEYKIMQINQEDPRQTHHKNLKEIKKGKKIFEDFIYEQTKLTFPMENKKYYYLLTSLHDLLYNVIEHAWDKPTLKECPWFEKMPAKLKAFYSWRVMPHCKYERNERNENSDLEELTKRASFFSAYDGPFAEISVAHTGVGMVGSLKAKQIRISHKDLNEEEAYLKESFSPEMDIFYSLHTIKKNIGLMNGYIELRSGKSYIAYNFAQQKKIQEDSAILGTNLSTFPGTMVRILVPANDIFRYSKKN